MTTLIKNGVVYDGSGETPKQEDVLIQDGVFAPRGSFPRERADVVIDATGALVTPGFVDIDTGSDHYLSLFSEPYQRDFIRQGVTTTIGGNCGASLAPLPTGSLDPIKKWGEPSRVNVNWRSMKEFLAVLETQGLGVNFGTLVGHSTIRRALIGDQLRDLTEGELERSKLMIREALAEGAFGFSTGLEYVHSRRVAPYEIEALAKVAALSGRVYATHLRNVEQNIMESVRETLHLAEATGVNVEISHLEPRRAYVPLYEEAVNLIESASATIHIHFDVCPFDTLAMAIYTFLPQWVQDGGVHVMLDHILSSMSEARLLEYFSRFAATDLVIGHVQDPALKFLEGKTVQQFAANQGLPFEAAFLRLLRMTRLGTILFYKDVSMNALESFLTKGTSIIASNGTALGEGELKQERSCRTFPAFLSLVAEKSLMPLERAVAKATGIPAKKYRLKGRGFIREGYAADLVVLRDFRPTDVLVNGVPALREGAVTNTLKGSILRASA